MKFLESGGGECGDIFRSTDWTQSILGPVENWPSALKVTLGMIFYTKQPMVLFWGSQYIKFYNDAYAISIPGKHPYAMGKRAQDVYGEIWNQIEPNLKSVIDHQNSTWFENQLLPIERNGKIEQVYWSYSQSPVLDESGKTAGVLVVCSDTTSQMLVKKHLEDSQKILYDFFIHAPVPMCILHGPEHEYLLANQHYEDFVGAKLVGRKVKDILPSETRDQYIQKLDTVFQTGMTLVEKNHTFTKENQDGSQTKHILNFIYQAFLGPSGKIEGILVVFQDITEETNKTLYNQRILSESKLAALGMMAAEIAHEIKNPLAILSTSCRVLQIMMAKEPFEIEPARKNINHMSDTIMRINEIVNSMKNLASDTSTEVESLYTASELIEDVVSLASYQLKVKNIDFVIKMSADVASIAIVCKKFQLSQVMMNLVSNAQYAVQDLENGRIEIQLLKDNDDLLIRVNDNGAGVPEHIRDRIFTALYTTKKPSEGTGLGLSISRELVNKHSGSLVLNQSISASCFEIRLPISRSYHL